MIKMLGWNFYNCCKFVRPSSSVEIVPLMALPWKSLHFQI